MIGRESYLATAIAIVTSGASLDIVGGKGSGRTAFLEELISRLQLDGWRTLRIRGIASLRNHPLSPLHINDIGIARDGRVGGVATAVQQLIEFAKGGPCVFFVDDWDDLDESSWGALEAAQRIADIPLVLTRMRGYPARHTPTGAQASTMEACLVLDMAPLKFDEIAQILEARLGGPVDAGAVSRVYAKSGGIIGLALLITDVAVRDRKMHVVDGEWVAATDLWSPTLRGVVEAYIEYLDGDCRDALELLSLMGLIDVSTARKVIEWAVLEQLEDVGLVSLYPSGSRQLITVVPPLLVEFFRHEPVAARRIRLVEHLGQRLGTAGEEDILRPDFENFTSAHVAEQDALFVRLVSERIRARRLISQADWTRNPSTITAVPYVTALLSSRASNERIESVLGATNETSGDDLSGAQFVALRARWRAYVRGDLAGALEELSSRSDQFGGYGRLLDANAAQLMGNLATVPENFAEMLAVTDERTPESVKVALWEVHAAALVCLGRFTEAQSFLRLIRESSPELSSPLTGVTHAFVLLGEGNFEAALSWATRGFDEAHGRLDADGLRNYAYVAALCLTVAGRYREVQELIDTVFALGEPPIFPQHAHFGLLEIASVVAVRRGQLPLGESLARTVDNIPIPDGPLPGLSRAWAAGQIAAANGRPQEAAQLMWDASEALWQRGARFSAAMGYLSYLELVPDRAALEKVTAKVVQLEGKFIAAHLAYVTANVNRDADALMACVEDLRTTGRYGQAVGALNAAVTLYRADNRVEDAQRASDMLSSLSVTLAVGSFDPNRFIAARAVLSDRELEIVDLVAEGLSNQQIATRLTLSVRTIESHVHRIMRKVGAENRRELKHTVEGFTAKS